MCLQTAWQCVGNTVQCTVLIVARRTPADGCHHWRGLYLVTWNCPHHSPQLPLVPASRTLPHEGHLCQSLSLIHGSVEGPEKKALDTCHLCECWVTSDHMSISRQCWGSWGGRPGDQAAVDILISRYIYNIYSWRSRCHHGHGTQHSCVPQPQRAAIQVSKYL